MQGRGEKRTRGYLVLLQRVDGRYLYRHFRSSSQLRRFVSCVFVPAGRYQLEDRQRSLTATPTRELIKKKSCIHCTQTPALLRRLSSEHTFKRRKRNEAKSAFPAGQYACACTRPLGPPVQCSCAGPPPFCIPTVPTPPPKKPTNFRRFLPPSLPLQPRPTYTPAHHAPETINPTRPSPSRVTNSPPTLAKPHAPCQRPPNSQPNPYSS